MGNCLMSQTHVVKIMKMVGKILEYRPSIKTKQVKSEFKGHAVSEMVPVIQYLRPEMELLGSKLYYLVPLPTSSLKVGEKKVRVSEPDNETGLEESKNTTLRIKLLISKQELIAMLETGIVSMDGRISERTDENGIERFDGQSYGRKPWKLDLESIPELD